MIKLFSAKVGLWVQKPPFRLPVIGSFFTIYFFVLICNLKQGLAISRKEALDIMDYIRYYGL